MISVQFTYDEVQALVDFILNWVEWEGCLTELSPE